MASLYLLIPIAIVFVCIAVGIFLWAVRTEQFEDLERQGYDILFDEDESKPTEIKNERDANEISGNHGKR
ncbi:cbb3-type cytochrome oxidase assembly protein CcoS [Photobacterium sp. BZF1]|uniref:cbb3-type cytochrome oxidase assembly protein CcoS n=1 Tax=Photobacterium sp. BZF1 TaxID=1904457 RepID=UPI001653D857|nr:cbb3-type cytochrome oxidase assembly protein CcoS [Photobacterium sp. BZF1]MBC7006119.1 cbb3-type cytochrome oxidase assembly protein CcoS [Photobacterium sp. BZF1]